MIFLCYNGMSSKKTTLCTFKTNRFLGVLEVAVSPCSRTCRQAVHMLLTTREEFQTVTAKTPRKRVSWQGPARTKLASPLRAGRVGRGGSFYSPLPSGKALWAHLRQAGVDRVSSETALIWTTPSCFHDSPECLIFSSKFYDHLKIFAI